MKCSPPGWRGASTATGTSSYPCFRLAQALTLEQLFKERLKRYNEEKKYRSGLRKPKRPLLPFSKIYFEATSAQ